ncbi:unnamed protein product [Calypogeia fissa]
MQVETVSTHMDSDTYHVGESSISFRPLPRHLTLQMDNSGKDNKNQIVMAFCSNLVGRGVFETVQLSFLMVGHTHEDVDALFSQVSKQVKHKEVATLQALMAEVWECEAIHPVPRFIEEVVSYKEYLQSFNVREIEGQSRPVAFLFSMRDNTPIYQYKFHVKQAWIPANGRCIWSMNLETNCLVFPTGDPLAKAIEELHKKSEEIIHFLKRYMEFLKTSCTDQTSAAYKEQFPLLKYWERVVDTLSMELTLEGEGVTQFPLKFGFWPKTNHGTSYKVTGGTTEVNLARDEVTQNAKMEELQNEYIEEMEDQALPFVGARSEREHARWTPLNDIKEGHFVFLRPEDDWEKTNGAGYFWLVRALGPVDPNHQVSSNDPERSTPMFQVQWWRPKHAKGDADYCTRYKSCFMITKTWERDPGFNNDTQHWQFANSAMYGFKFGMREINLDEKGLKIPKNVLNALKTYMQRIDE